MFAHFLRECNIEDFSLRLTLIFLYEKMKVLQFIFYKKCLNTTLDFALQVKI